MTTVVKSSTVPFIRKPPRNDSSGNGTTNDEYSRELNWTRAVGA